MLQWNPKLAVLVVALVLIASFAACGVFSFGGFKPPSLNW
jgi:hypothetical protein